MADRWAQLVARAQAGDRQAAGAVVEGNLGLVQMHAARLRGYRLDRDDLVAEGVLGILEAIRAHDLERGTLFATTAAIWIRRRQFDAVNAERSGGTVKRSQFGRDDALTVLAAGQIPIDALSHRLPGESDPETELARAEVSQLVREALEGLDARAREVVERSVMADEPETLTEIGGGPGAPRMRAARLQQAALERLRRDLRGMQPMRRAA